MSKKKLMILGAGIYQVPLIKKAKEMGLETLVVSIKGNYPGIALADSFYEIDTRDYEKILETSKREKISGPQERTWQCVRLVLSVIIWDYEGFQEKQPGRSRISF